MRTLWTIMGLLLATCLQGANSFYTQRLARMARALSLSASLPVDTLYANGRLLRVSQNVYGDIAHIGYKMFADEAIASPQYAPALTFIERYMLELDLRFDGISPQERMALDQVVITKGNLRQLRTINASMPFTIEVLPRRMYKMAWEAKNGSVEITFPADVQLLIGANAVELEEMMRRDVQRIMPMADQEIIANWEQVNATRSEKYMIVDGGKYLSDEIRGDIYLTELHGKRKLVCTPRNVQASIANIMLTGHFERLLPMHLRLDKYGYKSDEMDITLQQFIDYCKNEGCKLYFGVKTRDERVLTGTLFAYNELLAYNHVLSVSVPIDILDGKDAQLTATVYAYIPLQNVTERFFINDLHEEKHLRK